MISFEPVPIIFNQLLENIRINGLTNIKVFNFGFSNIEGEFPFYVDNKLLAASSMANLYNNSEIDLINCKVKELDHFIEQTKIKPDFIKCDVEGAELLVFSGGLKTINKFNPIIHSEMLRKWTAKFNYHPNEIIRFFSNLNYRCFSVIDDRLKSIDRITEDTTDTNFFFLNNDKHSSIINNLSKE